MLGGDAGLVQSGGLDQIADGFGLREVDAAVEVGPEGELAGLGQAGSGAAGSIERVAEHGGGAVAGDLNDVFCAIGFWGGEEGYDYVVDGVAGRVGEGGELRCPGSPVRRFAEEEDLLRDFTRGGAGETEDADASAAGRSGDGRDGIAELH